MKRFTRQQEAILSTLKKEERPLSVEEILSHASEVVDSINLSTIYRNLKVLIFENKVQKIDIPGENPCYEIQSSGHYHYFHCDDCSRVYRLDSCPGRLENLLPSGFFLRTHSITLHGSCADCVQ
ncbi:MAG: transcriptional repressor [Chlamydiae bacterium]|nr:transcriptional repressor [Chlamydiota bacterium]